MWSDLPDVQWDGYYSVEDDDVRPEGQEARKDCIACEFIPLKIRPEVAAQSLLPNGVSNGQDDAHTDEESKDLATQHI